MYAGSSLAVQGGSRLVGTSHIECIAMRRASARPTRYQTWRADDTQQGALRRRTWLAWHAAVHGVHLHVAGGGAGQAPRMQCCMLHSRTEDRGSGGGRGWSRVVEGGRTPSECGVRGSGAQTWRRANNRVGPPPTRLPGATAAAHAPAPNSCSCALAALRPYGLPAALRSALCGRPCPWPPAMQALPASQQIWRSSLAYAGVSAPVGGNGASQRADRQVHTPAPATYACGSGCASARSLAVPLTAGAACMRNRPVAAARRLVRP